MIREYENEGMIPMTDAKLPTTPDIPKIAEQAYALYFDDAEHIIALRTLAADTDGELSDAIAFDIRDLLHNGNEEDLFAGLDDIDALAIRFHDDANQLDELSDFIATIINTHHAI